MKKFTYMDEKSHRLRNMNKQKQAGWTITEIVALVVIGLIALYAAYDLVLKINQ